MKTSKKGTALGFLQKIYNNEPIKVIEYNETENQKNIREKYGFIVGDELAKNIEDYYNNIEKERNEQTKQ